MRGRFRDAPKATSEPPRDTPGCAPGITPGHGGLQGAPEATPGHPGMPQGLHRCAPGRRRAPSEHAMMGPTSHPLD